MKVMRKILLMLTAIIALKSNAQQVMRAAGNVKLVTTAGTKIVVNGGITFLGTSDLTSTGDSIILYNYNGATPGNWLDSTAAGAMLSPSNR